MVETLQIGILGPLRVQRAGVEVAMARPKQRSVLACLVANRQPIAPGALIEAAWGRSGLPARPTAALQTVVSRLRGALAPEAHIRRYPAGYVLDLTEAAAVDARRFDELVAAASITGGDVVPLLRQALALWRGRAWEGFEIAQVEAEAVRLEDARRVASERLAALLTAGGSTGEAVNLLRRIVREDPLQESSRLGLMAALHRGGRITEALDVFHDYRERLADELGLDPSPRMVEAHRHVLTNDLPTSAPISSEEVARPLTVPSFSPLIGRDIDAATLRRSVRRSRLVTVTGVGGVGKTRLAAEVLPDLAEDLSRRLTSVSCEGLAASEELPVKVAVAMGVAAPAANALGSLMAAWEAVPTLLVLDGCEQVAPQAARLVEELLARSSALRVVVTSRVPLGSPHEQLVRLEPLPVNGTVESVNELHTLLEAAGRRVRPGFRISDEDHSTAADLYQRLEGLPLAIELAGARAATLGLHAVRDGLDAGLQVVDDHLTDDRRSLRGILRWTFESLPEDAARLLTRLAVAAGPVDPQLAQALASRTSSGRVAAAFDQLVHGSLLVAVEQSSRPTYRILELIRRFAISQLTDKERERTEHSLIDWALELTDAAIPGALGSNDRRTLDLFNAQAANLELALLLAQERRPEVADTLAGQIGLISSHRMPLRLLEPLWQNGQGGGDRALPPSALAIAAAARAATLRGDHPAGLSLGELAWGRADGDVRTGYLAAHSLSIASLYAGRHDDAVGWCQRLLAVPQLPAAHRADTHATLALLAAYRDDLTTARREATTARSIASTSGASAYRAFAAYAAGEVALRAGDSHQARSLLGEASRTAVDAGATFVDALASTALGSLLVRADEPGAAGVLRRALTYWRQAGAWPQIWTTVRLIAEHASRRGDHATALLLLEAAHHHPEAPETTGRDADRDQRLRETARSNLDTDTYRRTRELARLITSVVVIERALTVCQPASHPTP